MEETKVVIEWEKCGNVSDVKKKNGEKDYGLYQIYGYHTVFGDDSLLYIGKAQGQTFSQRFKRRERWLKEEEWDIKIYIGRVLSIDDEVEEEYNGNRWNRVINDAEALLIYFHSPPYNSTFISDDPEPNIKLRIINAGDCGDLYPELSHEGLKLYDKHPRPSEE